ncbi:YpuI family protein [Halobacillus shinanisalinarum]|uniref:YpuI family protein n=1 Tax=Halobacillus shinanisalinarum TaxID=2932258 RepID=A0ABY4H0E4_9BACI|nr:DUF3907 family protein [Halobacillus shinanisalinarum]UOQ93629.1 YpuI family protein [Halobacillus shinanisalinarum]
MSQQMIKARTNEVHEFLNNVVFGVDHYLNTHSLKDLIEEGGSHEVDYYKQILKSLRRLNVFCDEARDKLSVFLQAPSFPESSAEKTLYGIYHQCVGEFFSPKGILGLKIVERLIQGDIPLDSFMSRPFP